jgi:rod shape determining protein RodA
MIGFVMMMAVASSNAAITRLCLSHSWARLSSLVVMVFGMITSGAQRWIRIGALSFQPSEFVKISLIIALAKFFQQPPDREGFSLKDLLIPFLLLIVPMGLILKQPDLGTAIILFLILFSVLLFVRIRWSSLLILGLSGASILPLLWGFLKEYQKRRIYTFFNPSLDPLGSGYYIIQSKIAGSGGIFGKGFMKGPVQLGFCRNSRQISSSPPWQKNGVSSDRSS